MTVAFLSYSMRDGALDLSALEQIAHQLHGAHEFVYVDRLHNRDVRPQDHLEHVLRSSVTLYALQTPAFRFSPWVRRELSLATRLRIRIVPVRWPTAGQVAPCSRAPQRIVSE
ncbi:TIR domain-containing protein [Nocardioides sp.]|uniref:TIR domain-containing protein n=1 Tax=Nocardioides sp. TaxID=35761 RepID=UPI0039C9AB2E